MHRTKLTCMLCESIHMVCELTWMLCELTRMFCEWGRYMYHTHTVTPSWFWVWLSWPIICYLGNNFCWKWWQYLIGSVFLQWKWFSLKCFSFKLRIRSGFFFKVLSSFWHIYLFIFDFRKKKHFVVTTIIVTVL